ncbi:hypothetical protein B0H12DRAFT_1100759 [Mycena haematopus]|nr:hypothetical protein B0H12DRAFT_1100759 [Mycena haematopus]
MHRPRSTRHGAARTHGEPHEIVGRCSSSRQGQFCTSFCFPHSLPPRRCFSPFLLSFVSYRSALLLPPAFLNTSYMAYPTLAIFFTQYCTLRMIVRGTYLHRLEDFARQYIS